MVSLYQRNITSIIWDAQGTGLLTFLPIMVKLHWIALRFKGIRWPFSLHAEDSLPPNLLSPRLNEMMRAPQKGAEKSVEATRRVKKEMDEKNKVPICRMPS